MSVVHIQAFDFLATDSPINDRSPLSDGKDAETLSLLAATQTGEQQINPRYLDPKSM